VFTKSPNDIGREFCYYSLDESRVIGLVVVGGSAGRHDWSYFGDSVNDAYGHLRLGQRLFLAGDHSVPWLADVTNDLWDYGPLAVLLPPTFCNCLN
jgi:hypothetical protein